MAIKKLTISFDIDMEVFMKMLQHGNSSMNIQVLGDKPKVAKEPKLLPAPNGGAKGVIMTYAKSHDAVGFAAKEVVPACIAAGYSKNTHSPQLMWLKANGYLKHKDGRYYPTAKGLTYGQI